jgi:myo-inositol-1-phosphate synthase
MYRRKTATRGGGLGAPAARVGAWLVGARGSVATTSRTGAAAVAAGLAPPTGLVTALAPFDRVALPKLSELVFGGHDLVDTPLVKRAEALAYAGVLPGSLLHAVADALDAGEADILLGVGAATGTRPPRRAIERIQRDVSSFQAAHALDTVVVVDLASTEARMAGPWLDCSLEALDRMLDQRRTVLPASVLYAYAALDAAWPFVDFTPSVATQLPALRELAGARHVPYAGRDGKTGQTLVRTALAPLFASRNLRVCSWSGTNLLGGGDGEALADPVRAASKLASKGRAVPSILGYEVDGSLHIDHVPDLGEWKTAWDHVSFEGFLGTRGVLQLTWQGCDSTLAAPLVLDLVRLVAAAQRAGLEGPLAPLGFFFKDPVGSSEHRLDRQFQALCDWAAGLEGSR